MLDDYAHHPTAVRETLKALRKRFPKRRLIAVYEPRSATSRRKTFQAEFADAFAHADEVIVGKMYDASKIPTEDRFDPEKLALDLHRSGTQASYIPDVDAIVKQIAESAAPGDVVIVLSSGSFDGLHDKLLDAIGDAIRPAQRTDMVAVRQALEMVSLSDEPARDERFADFFVLRNEKGTVGCVALEVLGEDAVLRALAVDPEFRGCGLRLDARRHGGRAGALARRAPDLPVDRERERLLRGEVRVSRRRSLDARAARSRRPRRSARRRVRAASRCGSICKP